MIPIPDVKVLTIKDYLDIFIRRRRLILIFPLMVILALFFHSFFMSDIYQATTMLLIKKSELALMNPKDDPISKRWSRSDFMDELNVLKSKFVAQRVHKEMKVDIPFEKFQEMVQIRPFLRTNMVAINVYGQDPELITNIANTWAEIFIDQEIDKQLGIAEYGVGKLAGQINETLTKLTTAEKKLQDFTAKYGDIIQKQELIDRIDFQKGHLENQIIKNSALYGDKHLKIRTLKAQIQDLDKKKEAEKKSLLALQNRVEEYHVLTKEVRVYKEIYRKLINRQKQLESARGLIIPDVKIWEKAEIPKVPLGLPLKLQIVLIFAGLLLGCVAAFVAEYFDDTLKGPEEVEFYAKMPVVGMIPFVKKWQMRGVEKNIINELNKPYSRLSDSGYKLKQSLLFCNTERKETKIVLPVSFSPGEGKTLVSIISGLAFVRGGEKVLLVDANLRNRQLSKTFNAGDKKGLSDSLIEKCDLSALILPVGENGLYLLPAGTLRINIELLESEAFRGELRRLKETFDRIIIDISSISSGPESFMLSGISDLIFMMISFGKTRVKDALEAQKLLEANEGKVIGGCLNFVPGVRPTDQFFWVLTKSDLSGLIRNIGSKIRDILKKD